MVELVEGTGLDAVGYADELGDAGCVETLGHGKGLDSQVYPPRLDGSEAEKQR